MKPTLEEYEQAKANMTLVAHAIQHCRDKQDQLIDELAQERTHEKDYLQLYERCKEVVFIYETYMAIEKGAHK